MVAEEKNWSTPGADRIANCWWKKAERLHKCVTECFQVIGQENHAVPLWFTEGKKTTLIPMPGEFTSDNQRPITCLNTLYKLFTACLLGPVSTHLNENDFMQGVREGLRRGVAERRKNLLIDCMACRDSKKGRNLSIGWIGVRKAYNSVDHQWLRQTFMFHWFADRIRKVVYRLSS